MSAGTEKPNVLIFGESFTKSTSNNDDAELCLLHSTFWLGGLNTESRSLAALLVPLEGDRLVGVSPIVRLGHRWSGLIICAIAFADSGQVLCGPCHHVSQQKSS